MNSALEVHNLSLSYGQNLVFNEASVQFPTGKFSAIIGPNGSGKSTLLNALVGLINPQSGNITFAGKNLSEIRSSIAYVPQRETVDWNFPATVYDVVAMGRIHPQKWWKRLNSEDKKCIDQALEQVNLIDFKTRQIGQLSGGQQQRVFIARALAQGASLFLLDEPFSGVDFASQEVLLQLLSELVKAGKTVVMVHHDMLTVKETVEWVALVHNGKISAGPTAELMQSEVLQKTFGWIQ